MKIAKAARSIHCKLAMLKLEKIVGFLIFRSLANYINLAWFFLVFV